MSFSYSQYLIECLILPVGIILFSLLLGCAGVLEFLRSDKFDKGIIIKAGVCLFICIFFLAINAGVLANGGIKLLADRENHTETVCGEIIAIDGMGRFQFPKMKSDYGYGKTNGVCISVGEIKLKAPTCGNLKVGDNVTVTFLPNSKYVLFIEKIED